MSTTRQIQSRLFPQSGMDSTSPPHLIEDGKWLVMSQMRTNKGYLSQMSGVTQVLFSLPGGATASSLYSVACVGTGLRTEQFNIFFSNAEVFVFKDKSNLRILKNKYTQSTFLCEQDPGNSGAVNRVVYTSYANQIWFTSPKTQLCSTDGASVIPYKPTDDTGTFTVHYTVVNRYSSAITAISTIENVGGSRKILLVKVTTNPGVDLSVDDRVSVVITTAFRTYYTREYLVVAVARTPQSFSSWTITLRTLDNADLDQIVGTAFITVIGSLTKAAGEFNTITTPLRVTFTLATKYNKYTQGQAVTFSGLNFPNKLNSTFIISQVNGSSSFEFYMNDLSNPVPGNQVATCRSVFNDVVPSAQFIENYYDHIIMANCTYKGSEEPWRVRWSNLYRPNDWEPRPESEADFYDVTSWQRVSPTINGITGMAKLRDVLYVYTDSCIVRCDYVGLPKVMQFRVVSENLGNFFIYGLVATKDRHYFFDATLQDFFEFDGVNPPQAIGGDIIGAFLSAVSLNYRVVNATQTIIGSHKPDTTEIWWTLSSSSYGSFVYNYSSKVWYMGVNTVLLGGGGTATAVIDDVVGTINSNTTAINVYEVAESPSVYFPLYQNVSGGIFESDTTAVPGIVAPAELVTKDFTVDLQRVVEVDRITIHASYEDISGANTAYILVEVSARGGLQDAVTYTDVGHWTQSTTPNGILSFPAMAGRIFRYRFTTVDIRNLRFYSFSDNVFNITAEK